MMARTTKEVLRACPTCGAKDRDMGLRDYGGWLFDVLPGRVSATDLDFVVEHHDTGSLLVCEFKPNLYVPRGQGMLFDTLTREGHDVWIIDDSKLKKDRLSVLQWNTRNPVEVLSLDDLRSQIRTWWQAKSAG